MTSVTYKRLSEHDNEASRILLRQGIGVTSSGYVRYQPGNIVMPDTHVEYAEAIHNFQVFEEDIWLMSHPKTGTTWTQEMIWCICNDLDFVGAQQRLTLRFPKLELSSLPGGKNIIDASNPDFLAELQNEDSVAYCEQLKTPRFLSTHLPWQLLPRQLQDYTKKPKMIYVVRNAKDTCLSYYHFSKTLKVFSGSFEDFAKVFIGETCMYSPFWSHVLGFWERQLDLNILFLKYEDMKKDLPSVIRQTADFLDKKLTEDQVTLLADHLSFSNMRDNSAVNYEIFSTSTNQNERFMRKGEADQWKTDMSLELIKEFDQWTKSRIAGTGLPY